MFLKRDFDFVSPPFFIFYPLVFQRIFFQEKKIKMIKTRKEA